MLSFRRHLAFIVATSLIFEVGQAQNASTLEDYWLGAERGPYSTGTIEDLWIDENRGELTTANPDDKRHITVQVWYPTDARDGEKAPYVLSPELFGESASWWLDKAEARETNSFTNAPVLVGEDPLPILVYNHGGGFPHFTGTFQAEFLASHGYVVVSIGHSGIDGIERYRDGYQYIPDVEEPQLSEEQRANMSTLQYYQWMWDNETIQKTYERDVEDISFALNQLNHWNQTPNHPFYRKLDVEQVGSFGWSMGGAASIQATVDEPRVRAAINLDGWLYGRPVEARGAPRPIMLIGGSESSESVADGPVDPALEELNSEVDRRLWQMLRLTEPDWYRVALDGAGHGHFSDISSIMGGPVFDGLTIERAHQVVNALTLEFFDKYVRGTVHAPILSGEESVREIRLLKRAPASEPNI